MSIGEIDVSGKNTTLLPVPMDLLKKLIPNDHLNQG
jgi:hypothetical protein